MGPPSQAPMYSCVAGASLDMGTEFLDIITPDEAASLVSKIVTMSMQYHITMLCSFAVYRCVLLLKWECVHLERGKFSAHISSYRCTVFLQL